jgi:hypothetical protein
MTLECPREKRDKSTDWSRTRIVCFEPFDECGRVESRESRHETGTAGPMMAPDVLSLLLLVADPALAWLAACRSGS